MGSSRLQHVNVEWKSLCRRRNSRRSSLLLPQVHISTRARRIKFSWHTIVHQEILSRREAIGCVWIGAWGKSRSTTKQSKSLRRNWTSIRKLNSAQSVRFLWFSGIHLSSSFYFNIFFSSQLILQLMKLNKLMFEILATNKQKVMKTLNLVYLIFKRNLAWSKLFLFHFLD